MAIIRFPAQRKPVDYRASERLPLAATVYVLRKGKPILKAHRGDISAHGMFLSFDGPHDLQKGRKVELTIAEGEGKDKQTRRLTGIVIRITAQGAALVTYDKAALRERA